MKRNILIIGSGGVAHVAAHKCAQHNDILGNIAIASRNVTTLKNIIESVKEKNSFKKPAQIKTYQLDAFDIEATKLIIQETQSEIVINAGSAFINMSVLQACIDIGVAYIDTAIHEDPLKVCEDPPWYSNYEWIKADECSQKKITAVLGAGFDPGVVNAYVALAFEDYFDSIDSVDIIDINDGSHGKYFATNFDPEINFREFTGKVWSWQNKAWTQNSMFEISREDDLPIVGIQKSYMTGHDEIHSLSKHFDIPNIRFWMGFGEHYINVFTVLNSLGLLSEKAVTLKDGKQVVPLQVVKALLPDPASLAPTYTGKTVIGNLIKGSKEGKGKEVFIYNVKDHRESYLEVGSQAISYTAGVPVVAAAILIARGTWDIEKMANIEELSPKPFLDLLNKMGLPNYIKDEKGDRPLILDI